MLYAWSLQGTMLELSRDGMHIYIYIYSSDFIFMHDFWCTAQACGKTGVCAYTARACGDGPAFKQHPSDFHLPHRAGARDVTYQRREAGTHAVSCHTVVASVGDVPTERKKNKRAGSLCFNLIHAEIYWIRLQGTLKQQLKTSSRVDVCV